MDKNDEIVSVRRGWFSELLRLAIEAENSPTIINNAALAGYAKSARYIIERDV